MTPALVVLVTLIGVAVLAVVVLGPVRTYRRTRGDRVVSCPDNGEPAGVRVDAAHAAWSSPSSGHHLRLESCSRWPEKAACGQACLAQIEAQPDDCLVRTQVQRWYADKSCRLCGAPLGRFDWTSHAPALLAPGGETMIWSEVKAERLTHMLASCEPVCWDCHVAETFRRARPDLVIDNPNPAPRG